MSTVKVEPFLTVENAQRKSCTYMQKDPELSTYRTTNGQVRPGDISHHLQHFKCLKGPIVPSLNCLTVIC